MVGRQSFSFQCRTSTSPIFRLYFSLFIISLFFSFFLKGQTQSNYE